MFGKIQASKIANNNQILASKPQKMPNDNIRKFYKAQNWFHVKSEHRKCQKFPHYENIVWKIAFSKSMSNYFQTEMFRETLL